LVATAAVALAVGGGAPPAALASTDHPAGEVPGAAGTPEGGHGEGAGHGEGSAHGPAIDGKTLGLQVFNFAVLLFILLKFGGRAVNKALLARHQQLKADLVAASEAKVAAEARLAKQELRLASLEKEIAAMHAGIRQEADAEKARLIAAAEERTRRVADETAFMLDQQIKEAELRLRHEVAASAVKMAEEILRRSIEPGDQQKMLDRFVGDVAEDRRSDTPVVELRKAT
jgi:F-type H+-transporting ATPase subunit b